MGDRLCLQGILYVLHQDIAWQLLPLELGFGSGRTCWRRLICDGRGTPLRVITAAADINDITQTLHLVDGIPQVIGCPGRRPESVLGDKAYDSGLGEHQGPGQTPPRRRADLAPLHQFKRLAVRWERRLELHDAFASVAALGVIWPECVLLSDLRRRFIPFLSLRDHISLTVSLHPQNAGVIR